MSLDDHLKTLFRPAVDAQLEKTIRNELDDLKRWSQLNSSLSAISHLSLPNLGPDHQASYQSETLLRLVSLDDAGPTSEREVRSENVDHLLQQPAFVKHQAKLIDLLKSKKSDEELSMDIAELVGYEELDFAADLVQKRETILSQRQVSHKPGHHTPRGKKGKGKPDHDFSEGAAKRRLAESLQAAADRPLWTGTARAEAEALPHVYTSSSVTSNHPSFAAFGVKYMLPLGTTREMFEDYEEVTIPPARVVPPRSSERLIPCAELPPLAKGSFPGYTSLNRIQSIVYDTAFKTNENMLICAPTGAGKTDVAMLTVLRTVDMHRTPGVSDVASSIRHSSFKIIYVAPMKALASEIVRKLGKRLAWLKIKVRELTGDMQLTKAEIAETQIIVTTPEKWDVVTRKPTGEGELASKVKLLIIDEVHLLNDERGAVIETIVARTVRQVESTQSLIRIVGLSATLPNYIDVADFLRVSRHTGLFFFDSSFRPVPLEQHFLGVKGKSGSPAAKRALDKTAYHLVSELVREGHQVMVFVHSRKDTVKSAESIKEFATLDGELEIFSCQEDPQFEFYRREIGRSKNKEMKQLFDSGLGIHHAGMLRADRNVMERLFEAKVIKVLCCTATLAWGVNLPAHGVVIKGTQLYDPSHGKFIDLSVLDVLQIFGRAGRPGMETSGVGYICTSEDKLQHYLEAVTAQHPIESKFVHGLLDSLNAEISLGTVTNVSEGAEWLGYTYLFVRMRKNPMVYGMTHDDPINDPDLTERRHTMITLAGRKLAAAGMVQFDETKSSFVITDIGRIAAKYYIRHASIEVFQKEFRPKMTEADVLALLSMSTEFEQIQVRENEEEELKALEEQAPCQIKGGTDTSAGKVNILLQSYISRYHVEDFALVSDTMYAAQNGGRIIRSLLEIALSRKWANASAVLMSMSKAVEKRIWGYEHPLNQFDLHTDVLHNLKRWADEEEIQELASQSAADLGKLIHLNEKHGAALLKAAKQFPSVELSTRLRPLSHELLQVQVTVRRAFEWSTKLHGTAEPFWIWVEDDSGTNILQLARVMIGQDTRSMRLDFIISVPGELPPFVTIRAISDRWMGAEDDIAVPFDNLTMPSRPIRQTSLLDLPLLRVDMPTFDERTKLGFSRLVQFNSIQTQCLWSAYNTDFSMILCAAASSGKSGVGQMAISRALRRLSGSQWILVVMPRADNARVAASQLRQSLKMNIGFALRPQEFFPNQNPVCVVTSRCLKSVLAQNAKNVEERLSGLALVVCEDLELLDDQYELSISILLRATRARPPRIVGIATALSDGESLANWLGVEATSTYCFPPMVRDQALSVTFQTFTIPYSAALIKAMAKPVYDTVRSLHIGDGAVVFAPSISQCKLVASELVTQCALGMNLRGFLGEDVSQDMLEHQASLLKDLDLVDGIMRGIGVWHDRMDHTDKILTLRLFAEGVIRVIIMPREACWSTPIRAALVIVMGTQYAVTNHPSDPGKRAERRVVEYSLHELVRMQGRAIRHGRAGRFHVLCQVEHREAYMRFLTDGLPLESQLLVEGEEDTTGSDTLREWLQEQKSTGSTSSRQDMMDLLSSTFLARRIERNPSYYGAIGDKATFLSRIIDRLWDQTTNQPPANEA